MRLFIAEKPSLGKAIAAGLPKPHVNKGSHIECGNTDVVTWCIGHVIGLANPHEYNADWKKWDMSHLPIIPTKIKRKVTNKKVFDVIKELHSKADTVCHAGDPDPEGQLIIDEVLDYLNNKKSVERLLISDLNLESVKKQLARIEPNEAHIPLGISAGVRRDADWLYGINMTRLYTLLGKNGGYDGVLSIGRVQTPVLGLVVKRDNEIKNFTSRNFYELFVDCSSDTQKVIAKWKPEIKGNDFDDKGRLLSNDLAKACKSAVNGKSLTVVEAEKKPISKDAPLCYSLSKLQQDASKKLGFSASKTLDVAQSLYETHKLTTYPRSDCDYLPLEHFNDVDGVVSSIKEISSHSDKINKDFDSSLKSKVWNDEKISAHHAIIPTPNKAKCKLNADEQKLYDLISLRYIMQFYGSVEIEKTDIVLNSGDYNFISKAESIIKAGWSSLEDKKDGKKEFFIEGSFNVGDVVDVDNIDIKAKKTTPPKHFDDGSLIAAMEGINKFVNDPELKKNLRDSDGIGTEATRANIIDGLFTKGFLIYDKKMIKATKVGVSFIEASDKETTEPDLTAKWQIQLKEIIDGSVTPEDFLNGITNFVEDKTSKGKEKKRISIDSPLTNSPCPRCEKPLKQIVKGDRVFWVHVDSANAEGCQQFISDHENKPVLEKPKKKLTGLKPCPKCKKDLVRRQRKDKSGHFWVHVNSQDAEGCDKFISDKKGVPTIK